MSDALTVRVPSPLGPRAFSFALQVAERIRYLGDGERAHEVTFRKARHARNMVALQAKDLAEGKVPHGAPSVSASGGTDGIAGQSHTPRVAVGPGWP